jgi:hypothetical protein
MTMNGEYVVGNHCKETAVAYFKVLSPCYLKGFRKIRKIDPL